MKKAIRFSVILIPLLILLIYLLKERSPFGESNTSFAADSGKEITRIEFTEDQRTLILEKRGGGWFVNIHVCPEKVNHCEKCKIFRDRSGGSTRDHAGVSNMETGGSRGMRVFCPASFISLPIFVNFLFDFSNDPL